jgi:hypothetical protein
MVDLLRWQDPTVDLLRWRDPTADLLRWRKRLPGVAELGLKRFRKTSLVGAVAMQAK